ncbi:NAD-dependent DNA ligase [Anopheles sinensis]|uniref:NAD-dependent DNA ligase n=1 Tax=Anopheles sinensis TaxID=74873 RepID=A0A084VGY1_ANOSI|nr:NAD-dependent DNA ligase [Anopheles sinensis]
MIPGLGSSAPGFGSGFQLTLMNHPMVGKGREKTTRGARSGEGFRAHSLMSNRRCSKFCCRTSNGKVQPDGSHRRGLTRAQPNRKTGESGALTVFSNPRHSPVATGSSLDLIMICARGGKVSLPMNAKNRSR